MCYRENVGPCGLAGLLVGMTICAYRKEIVMPINENIADFLRRYKQEHHLSVLSLSELLGIATSATVTYLTGNCNPRSNTLDLIADKCGVSVAEIVSAYPWEWEQAEIIVRAAAELGKLSGEQREKGIQHFLALASLFSESSNT